MVGIVLVGHCNLAEEFHKTVKAIVGEVDYFISVSVESNEVPDKSMKRVSDAIRKADNGDGVLVLTDMFPMFPDK